MISFVSFRWGSESDWETSPLAADFEWKQIAEPVMKLYTEATDGSYIETKESALVWHHQDADPYFGSCQAIELLDHLENVLANEPVVVQRGQQIVEAKPQVWTSSYTHSFSVVFSLNWPRGSNTGLINTAGNY